MKDNTIILFMLIILLSLIARLFFTKNENASEIKPLYVQYEDLIELSVFVTLENKIAQAENEIIVETMNGTKTDTHASVSVGRMDGTTEGDINRKPDYMSLYPNLYTTPLSGQQSPGDGRKVCFLTFDDGPSEYTWKTLDILDEKGIKATFFVVGESMTEKEIECLNEIVSRGHTIGIHAYHHDYKNLYHSVDSFLSDYEKVYNMVVDATGVHPNIYRFPGGSYNKYVKKIRKAIVEEMERRGFTYYDWNVSGEDSVGNPNARTIKKNIFRDLNRFQCPVVLLHDGSINEITSSILSDIIDEIVKSGYEFDTLDNREPCQFAW